MPQIVGSIGLVLDIISVVLLFMYGARPSSKRGGRSTMRAIIALCALFLAGCSTTEYRMEPTGLATNVSAEQADADCKLEQVKATSGMQNLGMIVATASAVRETCLASKGWREVEVAMP